MSSLYAFQPTDEPNVLLARLRGLQGTRLDDEVKQIANEGHAFHLVASYTMDDLRPCVEEIFDRVRQASPMAAAVLRFKTLVAIFSDLDNSADAGDLDGMAAIAMAMGPAGPHLNALRRFASHRRNHQFSEEFKLLAKRILQMHCVEALPLLQGALSSVPVKTLPPYQPLEALIWPGRQRIRTEASPQDRLRKTLEFLRDEGVDLDAIGSMQWAFQLKWGSIPVLLVLLDLGVAPQLKGEDQMEWEATAREIEKCKQWNIVVHSFCARRTAQQLLECIDDEVARASMCS